MSLHKIEQSLIIPADDFLVRRFLARLIVTNTVNDYIETTKPLVVITAPGPGSGKMATCLSQLYHETNTVPRHIDTHIRRGLVRTLPENRGESGKMATCLSQLYHEHKRGIHAGYAKFETFPIWNLPLHHPVNRAYEAATADLNDVNMIDPFHLEAYGETTVNYN